MSSTNKLPCIEVIELTAQFLAGASDMHRLLFALPNAILGKRLESLKSLFRLQATGKLTCSEGSDCPFMEKDLYSVCQPTLWPKLCFHASCISPEIYALLSMCLPLYSVVDLCPKITRFTLPSTTKYYPTITSQQALTALIANPMARSITIEIKTLVQFCVLDSNFKRDFSTLKLEHIHLIVGDGEDNVRLVNILTILEAMESLVSLELTLLRSKLSDNQMSEALASWMHQRRNSKLTVKSRVKGKKFFSWNMIDFKGRTNWFQDQRVQELEFKNNQLAGFRIIALDFVEIGNFLDFIRGVNVESITVGVAFLNWLMPYHGRSDALSKSLCSVLRVLAMMSKLKKLRFYGYEYIDFKCCKLIAKILPRLEVFEFIGGDMGDKAAGCLIKVLPHCKKLQKFSLVNQWLTNKSAIAISDAISQGASYRELDLSKNQIYDDGAIALSKVMGRLDSLNLSQNHILKKGATAIASMMQYTNHMEQVDLTQNTIKLDTINTFISTLSSSGNRMGHVLLSDSKKYDPKTLEVVKKIRPIQFCRKRKLPDDPFEPASRLDEYLPRRVRVCAPRRKLLHNFRHIPLFSSDESSFDEWDETHLGMTSANLTNLGLVEADSSQSFSVLIVGDGNFSYTCALARQLHALRRQRELPCIRIIASSLDTAEELAKMYPGAAEKLAEIQEHDIQVLHDLNATRLETYLDRLGHTKFDRIVFNFPHYAEGGNKRNKIHKHRQLLTQFFKSSVNVLAPHGQVWVTLCAGQGGTQAEKIVRAVGDTWQVAQCAASANLILFNVHEAPVDALYQLGYNSVGHRLQEKAFRNQAGLTHVFCRDSIGEVACYPLIWSRDISFWVNPGFNESKFVPVLEKVFGSQVAISVEKIDEYVSDQGRRAFGYRLSLSSSTMALSKEYVNAKCEEVVDILDKHVWND